MRAVAAIPALGLLAGAALGLHSPVVPLSLRALLLACGLMAVWAWHADRSGMLAAVVSLAFAIGGSLLAAKAVRDADQPTLRTRFDALAQVERTQAVAEGRMVPLDDAAFASLAGALRADAAPTPSGVSLSVDVNELAAPGRLDLPQSVTGGVLATVVGSLSARYVSEWRAGRRVRFPIQLRRPSRYLDPGVPDHGILLARRGTTLVGTVKSGALVEVVARGGRLDEWAAAARAAARRIIASAVGRWSTRSAAIVAAIVIGDRAGLDDEVERRLQEAGTYHVIAISGGNIAILAGVLLGLVRLAGVLGRIAMLVVIVALVAYGYLVGGGASVNRATFMAVVYFAGRVIDQRSPPLNTLALAAAVLLVFEPLSVVDPAFILTFGATLGILIAVPHTPFGHLPNRLRPLATMFMASLAAETLLFPVGAIVFSRVTFAGLALNFLAIPLMGVAQIAGMVLMPAALVSARLGAAVGWVAHLGAAGLVGSAGLVGFAPALTYRVAAPSARFVCAYYFALLAWWVLRRRRSEESGSAEPGALRWSRRSAAVCATAAALWILAEPWAFLARRGDGRLHVTFIDVGQGDATLVRFPRGSTLLVDAGGLSTSGFDVGDRVVAPVLREAGVGRLGILVLTHGDPDHIGGAASVVREFRAREVWEGIAVPSFEPLQFVRAAATDVGARWRSMTSGAHALIDDVEVAVRHPPPADWERRRVRNDDSIVLELRWRNVSLVLPGDIGAAAERLVIASIRPAPVRVVKVPHHGSRTSSTEAFVRALAPRVAVVSAGRGNRFGHPASDVIDRYHAAGTELFRTDADGAIMLDTDGWSVDVRSFTGRHFKLPDPTEGHEADAR